VGDHVSFIEKGWEGFCTRCTVFCLRGVDSSGCDSVDSCRLYIDYFLFFYL